MCGLIVITVSTVLN